MHSVTQSSQQPHEIVTTSELGSTSRSQVSDRASIWIHLTLDVLYVRDFCARQSNASFSFLFFFWWKTYPYENFKQNKSVYNENKPPFTPVLSCNIQHLWTLYCIPSPNFSIHIQVYIFPFSTDWKHTTHIPLLFAFSFSNECSISEHSDPPILFNGSIAFQFMNEP